MVQNHMIIGLGGTGGKVIRDFRKLYYQEFRDEEPKNVKVSYLYIDSSPTLMEPNNPEWRTLGTSVQLSPASQMLITGTNLLTRLDNIEQYPGLRPWIGTRRQWDAILAGKASDAVGGQKRRLGRFLFACKADDFVKRVSALTNQMRAETNQSHITFHVVAGLAGGTGSGSIVDVVTQLRKEHRDSSTFTILLHVLLPEMNNNKAWDTGNYHANGYAALTELNAMAVKAYSPHDVVGKGDRVETERAFNGCYLFTNHNTNGMVVDVSKTAPEIMADFLFQRIVVSRAVSWDELYRIENAENQSDQFESLQEKGLAKSVPLRSKAFLSYGIKRVAIPEEEIREFLAMNYAKQAALQLRSNNWRDGIGFVEEARNQDYGQVVRRPDIEESWCLSEEFLTLAKPILPSDDPNRKWKNLDEEWQGFMPALKERIRVETKREGWLDGLERFCAERFEQNFRNLGVTEFYRTKLRARKEMASEIRGHVERHLFSEWENGSRSMAEVSGLLASLTSWTQERMAGIDERVRRMREAEDEELEQVESLKIEWARTGLIGSILGKHDKVFDEFALRLQSLYAIRTKIEAQGFAKQLLAEVLLSLQDLQANVGKSISNINMVLEKLQEGMDSRVKQTKPDDVRGHLIRYFDPTQVEKVTRTLVTDEEQQRTQTTRARTMLLSTLGDGRNFGIFNTRFSGSEMLDALERACDENAKVAHDTLITSSRDRILNVSIIEKLKEEYGSDMERLRSYVTDLVHAAGCFVEFNEQEVTKVGPSINSAVRLTNILSVFLPKSEQHADFVQLLKKTFRETATIDVQFHDIEGRDNEITLVAAVGNFPLRTLSIVERLKEAYLKRVEGDNREQARLELHTDGDGSQFPSLYAPTQEETLKRALPSVLIARALNLIVDTKNPQTGKSVCQLTTRDADDYLVVEELGPSFMDVMERLDIGKIYLIEDEVAARLSSAEYRHLDSRLALEAPIRAIVDETLAHVSNDGTDPQYRRVRDAAGRATTMLREGVV